MKYSNPIKVALISSYSPQQCRIAAFTSRLVQNTIFASGGRLQSIAVAMQSKTSPVYPQKADFVIRNDVACDYMEAVDFIHFRSLDMVLFQHEISLFTGESGIYMALLLKRLSIPIITTLHTVLEKPDPSAYQSVVEICDCSRKVIVMSRSHITTLTGVYGVSAGKIEWIPQGVSAVSIGGKGDYQYKIDPGNSGIAWLQVGRAYWKLIKMQVSQPIIKQRLECIQAGCLNFEPAELVKKVWCPSV